MWVNDRAACHAVKHSRTIRINLSPPEQGILPAYVGSEGEQEKSDRHKRQGGSDSDFPDALEFLFAVDRLRLGDSFCFPSSHIVFPFRDPGPMRNPR